MIDKSLFSRFHPDLNFWEAEPQFKAAGIFKKLYDADKTKNKKKSSAMMWFVAFCYDMGSKYRKLEIADKHAIIGEDFCGDEKFYDKNKEDLDLAIRMYMDMQDSEAERSLREWEEGMRDRRQFLSETPYGVETYKMLEDMRKNTKTLYADLARIKKDLEAEGDEGRAKGGKQLSASDMGDLTD